MSEEAAGKIGFVILALAVVVLFIVAEQRDTIQQEAVERGHAEWVIDSEGNTEWRWKGGSDE